MYDSKPKKIHTNVGILKHVKSYRISLGFFLATYGLLYLSTVILSGWTIFDWGKDLSFYPLSSIVMLLPRSLIAPIFFVTSFPALIIGAAILSIYSLFDIKKESSNNKEVVAIILTASGFTYQVIGAWPLGNLVDFPWEWQKQIVSNGAFFTWTLYLLSLTVLAIGVISLYKHSRIYHEKYPELSKNEQKLL